MGMSASQLRYVMLTGRKSDVEFQGQQINQQRTTLATETSAYNTQLLNLVVPTPPSSDQYVTTSYTFSSNGQTRTVAGTVYNAANNPATGAIAGTYTVNYTTEETIPQGESTGSSIFSGGLGLPGVPAVPGNPGTPAIPPTNASPPYKTTGGTVLTMVDLTNQNSADYGTNLSNLSLIAKDCGIKDKSGNSYGDAGYVMPQFYSYASDGKTKYVLEDDLKNNGNTTTPISTYDVNDSAKVTTSSAMQNAQVTWSSSGRMASITDSDGHNYSLSVTSANDNSAYEDAYNEYEYKKNQYDQQMDNINSQVDIVESQDKKLELKLQNLDTQQQALSTEMDSVKKVVDKNIETSFKAFA